MSFCAYFWVYFLYSEVLFLIPESFVSKISHPPPPGWTPVSAPGASRKQRDIQDISTQNQIPHTRIKKPLHRWTDWVSEWSTYRSFASRNIRLTFLKCNDVVWRVLARRKFCWHLSSVNFLKLILRLQNFIFVSQHNMLM